MDFMDRLGPEVGGRMVARSDENTGDLLQRFARGECTESERKEACKLMQDSPELLRVVASELKKPAESKSPRTPRDE